MEPFVQSLLHSRVRFQLFGVSHLVVLAVTVVSALALVALGRARRDHAVHGWLPRALGLIIVVSEVVFCAYPLYTGEFNVVWGLPLQLCDLTALILGFGLLTRQPFALEVGYFLGLSATLLTTLTPDLAHDFPHLEFFCFFLTHALVAVAALYAAFGLDHRPRPRAAVRVWLAVNAFGLVAMVINRWLGSNYLYISRKPPTETLFDLFGPWPWYVIWVDMALATLLAALAVIAERLPPLEKRPG